MRKSSPSRPLRECCPPEATAAPSRRIRLVRAELRRLLEAAFPWLLTRRALPVHSRRMRVVELSNHPGDMLDDAARRRQAAERRVLSVYEDELVRHRARVQSTKVNRDRARARHAWWTWLKLTAGVWREKRRIPRPPLPA